MRDPHNFFDPKDFTSNFWSADDNELIEGVISQCNAKIRERLGPVVYDLGDGQTWRTHDPKPEVEAYLFCQREIG